MASGWNATTRAYKGSGAEPPVGFRGRALGGIRGKAPEAERGRTLIYSTFSRVSVVCVSVCCVTAASRHPSVHIFCQWGSSRPVRQCLDPPVIGGMSDLPL